MRRPGARILAGSLAVAAIGAAVAVWVVLRPRTPPGTSAHRIERQCSLKRGDAEEACVQAGLDTVLADSGVAVTMAALKLLANADRDIERDGHVYAHGIGIKGFLASQDVPSTFDQCPTDFASGCAHGVIQAYLEGQDSLDDLALNRVCDPYRSEEVPLWRLFQCVHGMGHGLVMMTGGDLPKALTSCDALHEGWDRDSCYGGAFMENIMRTIAPHHPATELAAGHEGHQQTFKALDSTDLLYPCTAVENRYHRACYEIQTAAILHFTKGKIKAASVACDSAPEGMRPTCYSSLGRDISSKALRDPGRSARYCRQAGEAQRPWCYFGVAKSLVDWEAQPAAGFAFCRRLGEVRGSNLCFQAVGEQIASLAPVVADREARCGEAGTAKGVAACRWGAAVPGTTQPPAEE